MSALAQEVSRRMTPGYAKERAKEMARDRAYEMRDRAVDSPWVLPLVGAGIGALVGRALLGRAQQRLEAGWRRDWDRPQRYGSYEALRRPRYERDVYGSPYGASGTSAEWDEDLALATSEGGDGGSSGVRERLSEAGSTASERAAGMKDRISDKATELGDRASDVKERLGARAGELGDRVRERASALRERMPDRESLRSSAHEQPGMWALGAAAMGALLGFALPLSGREREVIEPMKGKMREATHQAMDRAAERVEHMDEGAREGEPASRQGEDEARSAQPSPGTTALPTNPPSPEPLH
jgi:hypothetical protein